MRHDEAFYHFKWGIFGKKCIVCLICAVVHQRRGVEKPHGTRYVPVNWFLCAGVHVREFKLIPTHSESKMDSGNEMKYIPKTSVHNMDILSINIYKYRFFEPPYMKICHFFLESPLPWAFLRSRLWLSLSLVFWQVTDGRWGRGTFGPSGIRFGAKTSLKFITAEKN